MANIDSKNIASITFALAERSAWHILEVRRGLEGINHLQIRCEQLKWRIDAAEIESSSVVTGFLCKSDRKRSVCFSSPLE